MPYITIVGLGPGSKEYMTRASEDAVSQADILVGGHRQLNLFNNLPVEKYEITADMDPLFEYLERNVQAGKKVVVLASGDPGFYGILATMKRRLPGFELKVFPGISSIQLACARFGITWDDAFLTSCHGRDLGSLVEAVSINKKVITLTDSSNNPPKLAEALLNAGINNTKVFLACNLAYPDETITATTLEKLAQIELWNLNNCVMVISNE